LHPSSLDLLEVVMNRVTGLMAAVVLGGAASSVVAVVESSAPASMQAADICVGATASGLVNAHVGPRCVSYPRGVFCVSPSVGITQETVTVDACVPD
jgi:hypothetical protein